MIPVSVVFAAATSHFPMRGEHTVRASSYLTAACRVTGVKQFINVVHAHIFVIYCMHIFEWFLFKSFVFSVFCSNVLVLLHLKTSAAAAIVGESIK